MRPFLQQVAEHYFHGGDSGHFCFVFPNLRSMKFFQKYFTAAVANHEFNPSGKPVLMPRMLSMSDFFSELYGGRPSDRVTLVLELYECYRALNTKAETLDDFIFWGDVILNDFADIDKYRVNARAVLTNVADFRQFSDYSDMSAEQREAIARFVGHFRESDGEMKSGLTPMDDNVKARFLSIWNLLFKLYSNFQERLLSKGMAYEGMIYRSVAESVTEEGVVNLLEERFGEGFCYVFVGLNVLNECERTLLTGMRNARIARFCWDWQSEMIRDPQNRSSFFMKDNFERFPMDWNLDPLEDGPRFHVRSVPSSVGQAKQLPTIFKEIGRADLDTAVVLPDENLLMPVLNSIPLEIQNINVTMGYPMAQSSFCCLMDELMTMQLHLRESKGRILFYRRQLWGIFSMSLFYNALDEDGRNRVAKIKTEARYYVPQDAFKGNTLLETLFRPVISDPASSSPEQIRRIQEYQHEVILSLVPSIKKNANIAYELEAARRYYCVVNLLKGKELSIRPQSYFRLLSRLLSAESMPFSGEPLKGLQIMGPLETRALDFKNLIILSCNEGIFPRRNVSSSFIPAQLRRGFGLPTYEHQDAVWAYYFYRCIQRAESVWLLYDSRTEGLKSGEESRYIKQLQYHFRVPIERSVAGGSTAVALQETEIPEKTNKNIEDIRNGELSASSVQKYLKCPAMFYYYFLEKLRPADEVSESLDTKMIGNVFHRTMEEIYGGGGKKKSVISKNGVITIESLKNCLKTGIVTEDRESIQDLVRENIIYELNPTKLNSNDLKPTEPATVELNFTEVNGRNLVFERVLCEYVKVTLKRDIELLEKSGGRFSNVRVEQRCYWTSSGGFKFTGIIDRLDCLDGRVRVVDYKTGKVMDSERRIPEGKASVVCEKLFAPCTAKGNSKRPEKALQLFLYDMFVRKLMKEGKYGLREGMPIYNSIYHPASFFSGEVIEDEIDRKFVSLVEKELDGLLAEMTDLSLPFIRTDDREGTCSKCYYKNICGR